MQIRFDELFKLGPEEAGLSTQELQDTARHLEPYREAYLKRGQGFHQLPKLKGQILACKKLAQDLEGSYKDIVILGIGGSALGITTARDALKGPYWNFHGEKRLFVLDNIDLVDEVEKVIDLDSTLFIVISKSGRTPETMAQYFYFREKVPREQFVFITDPSSGELRHIGNEEKISMLDIPANVGGRFSVLSPVGLFPMALLGIDIEAMLEGAEDMLTSFEANDLQSNLPFQLAAAQYLLEWKHGIHMTVMMPYSTRLWSFADWYRQLLAESIGKDGKGLTPIKALGATDQHSQVQLYNEGPTDKLFLLIEVEESPDPKIPQIDNEKLSYLSGVGFHQLMNTEKRATEQALTEYKKPVISIEVPKVDAYVLGQLFMLFEASIAFLGEFYSIDAFNQPGVELGKDLTKQLLSS